MDFVLDFFSKINMEEVEDKAPEDTSQFTLQVIDFLDLYMQLCQSKETYGKTIYQPPNEIFFNSFKFTKTNGDSNKKKKHLKKLYMHEIG